MEERLRTYLPSFTPAAPQAHCTDVLDVWPSPFGDSAYVGAPRLVLKKSWCRRTTDVDWMF